MKNPDEVRAIPEANESETNSPLANSDIPHKFSTFSDADVQKKKLAKIPEFGIGAATENAFGAGNGRLIKSVQSSSPTKIFQS